MTTLTRGSQFDIASSGQRPPIDIWAIATKGIWITQREFLLPPESCWITIGHSEQSATVNHQESAIVVNMGDRAFTIRRGC